MSGSKRKFPSLEPFDGGSVVFGGGIKGCIIGSNQVKLNQRIINKDVNLVKNLKFDLLSVSKLCDNERNKVAFYSKEVVVKDLKTKEVLIEGKRHKQIYKIDDSFDSSSSMCLSTLKEDTGT